MLIAGSIVMGISMVIVGIIVAKFRHDWPSHAAAGWAAVGMCCMYSLIRVRKLTVLQP